MSYDSFGALIFCRFCKSKNFDYNHHPNDCHTCYGCGRMGHNKKDCQTISLSPRRLPFIDNSHLLLPDEPVSIDVEKVRIGRDNVSGWVVICQYPAGKKRKHIDPVVFSAKVRRLKREVTSYSTPWSGLTRIDLSERALPLEVVQIELKRILKNRLVVGIGLREDLRSLGLEDVIPTDNQFEFMDHFIDDKDQPISLKALAYGFFGKLIQDYSPGFSPERGHDPVIDARMTIKIYKSKDHAHNQPIGGRYQWIRNLVDEAKRRGLF